MQHTQFPSTAPLASCMPGTPFTTKGNHVEENHVEYVPQRLGITTSYTSLEVQVFAGTTNHTAMHGSLSTAWQPQLLCQLHGVQGLDI